MRHSRRVPYHRSRSDSDRNCPAERAPYRRRISLLSPGELAFFRVLRLAVEPSHWISIKVRLADVVQCPSQLWNQAPGRRLSQKHIDFVLYDYNTTRIVAAIELDDSSHDRPQRLARDQFIDQTLKATNTPLIRVRAASRYDAAGIRKAIKNALQQVRPMPRARIARQAHSLSSRGSSPRRQPSHYRWTDLQIHDRMP